MRKKSIISTFFIVLLCMLLKSTFNTEVFALTTPKVAIVSLDHVPFVAGDKNEFYISAKNYTGQVQYQLFYIQESVMKEWKLISNPDMVNGWTNAVDAQSPTVVSISNLNLKADKYRFAIRVRRVGVKGLKQNSYGDYDDAYPFNLDVVKAASIELSGNMNMEKTNFTKSENLVIAGVGNLSGNVQYKLHLFDVKNSKWLTDLTEYNTSVNYSLKDIPEGTYIIDLWAKNSTSKNKYDGWKLKTITVQNTLVKGEVIKFADPKLELAIRNIIYKPTGDIYKSDVEKVDRVEWYFEPDTYESTSEEQMIVDLSGIENLTNLEILKLQGNNISDLSKLAGLTNLKELYLDFNNLTDITPLAGLKNLTYLDLSENGISDISPLAGLTNLTYLDLYYNDITDISALKGLINLESIDLYDNSISDISPLKGLTNLMDLDLGLNAISDISALKDLTYLIELYLDYNNISDISVLSGLTNLESLNLFDNNISNINALKGLPNLMFVDLSNNQVSDADIQALKNTLPKGAEVQ